MSSLRVTLSLFVVALFTSLTHAAERPNFVIINIDDLGYADIGPFGSEINRTPNLDRMAAEGRKLTCFYAAPVCSPSRASLMTGCYPKRSLSIPHVLFPGNDVGLDPGEITIAELLKEQGYATGIIGKWHLGDQEAFLPLKQGFDYYYGLPYSNDMGPPSDGIKSNLGAPLPKMQPDKKYQPPLPLIRNNTVLKRMLAEDQTRMVTEYTAEAVKFIEGHQDGPFFLYLPHSAVHFPLYPGKEFQGRTGHGLYSDWVEEVDWSVGKVLDAVRESKNSKKTFVMFTSDNGGSLRHGAVNKPLRGGKGSTLEGGMRVPTIAWWPGKIPAGTATPEVAGMFDMLPTLVGLADGKLPQDRTLDGRDIWPLLSGEENAKTPHDVFYYFRGLNLEAVRRGDWKLRLKDGELYNLDQDIAEANNVAKNNADIVSELTQLAAAMDSDLGQTDKGPGCRPLGHVDNARPIISDDGRVRKDMQFEPPLTGE
ncbi:MAG: sulfatase [Planctomycetaceae bacterium]|nr:sulfatase [Planctomycetaceae bacterium]